MSQCSFPECDIDRVRAQVPDWSEETRKQCLERKLPIEIVTSSGCRFDCKYYDQDQTLKDRQRLKVIRVSMFDVHFTDFSTHSCLKF